MLTSTFSGVRECEKHEIWRKVHNEIDRVYVSDRTLDLHGWLTQWKCVIVRLQNSAIAREGSQPLVQAD